MYSTKSHSSASPAGPPDSLYSPAPADSSIAHAPRFGEWVKRRRKALDMTQADLAAGLSCSLEMVRKIEQGLRRPSRQLAELLAGTLQIGDEQRDSFLALARLVVTESTADLNDTQSEAPLAPAYLALVPSQVAPSPMLCRHNLPTYLTTFIGREKALDDLEALLSNEAIRLLVLVGAGGSGKTRLAVQLARRVAETSPPRFPDGVFFTNLAPILDPGLVLSTIADSLEVREQSGQPLLDTLKSYLKDRQLMLLVDNFERVGAAAPQLGELLDAAPKVKMLVTSRAVLAVYGEQDYEVPPLPLPRLPDRSRVLPLPYPSDLPELEQLQLGQMQFAEDTPLWDNESVRLFADRTHLAKPDFQLNISNIEAVAELCIGLDGLPLAIELAAARIRVLPPRSMLSQMGHRLALLIGGPRDMPARQQTLRATIDWSYGLLDEQEKRLFGWLSVFQGGRSLQAVEAICGAVAARAGAGPQVDWLAGVSSLVDKNLLRQRQGAGGEPRFWMLETLHEFAQEKVQESGEVEALRTEHARYFLALAVDAEGHLVGPDQQAWLELLEEEHNNLRLALQWAKERDEPEDVEAGLRAASALYMFWSLRGHYTEGRAYLQDLLDKTGRTPGRPKESQVKAMNAASSLAYVQGDQPTAQPLAEEALRLAREVGDKACIARALHNLGLVEWNLRKARAFYEESLVIMRELGDKHGIASTLNCLGVVAVLEGDLGGAHTLYEESLAKWRELGNRAMVAWELLNIGIITADQGEHDSARALTEESLAISKELGERENICSCMAIMGNLAVEEGDYSGARALYDESLAMAREMGVALDIALVLTGKGHMAYVQGDYTAASALFDEATAVYRDMGDQVSALWFAGLAANLRGECETALSYSERALALSVENQGGSGIYQTLVQLGGVFVGMGQIKRGAVLLGAADGIMRRLGGAMGAVCRTLFERVKDTARTQLGEEAFENAWQEGQAMCTDEAVEYAKEQAPPPPTQPDHMKEIRIRALNAASALAAQQGDLPAARPLAEQALALAREVGDKKGIADALNDLGNVAYFLWDNATARTYYEESLAIRRTLGDKEGIARSVMSLGSAIVHQGDAETARVLHEESLAMWRELGDQARVAMQLFNLGLLFFDQGNCDHARSLFEESLAISKTLGDKDTLLSSMTGLGHVALEAGEYSTARELFDQSLAMAQELGVKQDIRWIQVGMGNLALAQEDRQAASIHYDEVSALCREIGDTVYSLYFSGIAAWLRGDYAAAASLHRNVLATYWERHQLPEAIEALSQLGVVMVEMGQVGRGTVLMGAVDGQLASISAPMCYVCRRAYEHAKDVARVQLGEAEFEKAWQEGYAMSMEEAVEYASREAA